MPYRLSTPLACTKAAVPDAGLMAMAVMAACPVPAALGAVCRLASCGVAQARQARQHCTLQLLRLLCCMLEAAGRTWRRAAPTAHLLVARVAVQVQLRAGYACRLQARGS